MSHGFKLRFDQMRESNPAKSDVEQEPAPVVSGGMTEHLPGHARNLCLVWPDGRRAFYSYAYLVYAEFEPHGEMNSIQMTFSSQTVRLKGYGLESLFMQLLDHLPRIITAIDPRYMLEEEMESIVVDIDVVADDK